MDAIGSLIIAGYIFYIAYVSLKKSSLNLVDAWENPKVVDKIKNIIQENKKFKETVKVNSVLLRPSGITGAHAEIQIEVDGYIPLTDVELLCIEVEMAIRSEISTMNRISIIPRARSTLNKRIIEKRATTIN
jgi:divalent metal cation (Fe/Co/Zn/Cd) transporter